ncbi:hypothetical protein MLD38_034810 [Melastoma candidum]|uniref:Uncharacterized protein n=1 Tax=Melastoma candidum TaxID=119954 RepID=A0ACB9MB44_9MYRT|nr:hypothetical protein MLD38_034810 [Melastoma candidum]
MQRDFERAVTLDIKDTKSHPIPPFLLVSSRVLLLPVSILLPSSFGEPATPYHHLGPGSVGILGQTRGHVLVAIHVRRPDQEGRLFEPML